MSVGLTVVDVSCCAGPVHQRELGLTLNTLSGSVVGLETIGDGRRAGAFLIVVGDNEVVVTGVALKGGGVGSHVSG